MSAAELARFAGYCLALALLPTIGWAQGYVGNWQDMESPNCQITIHANNDITYRECPDWRYVGVARANDLKQNDNLPLLLYLIDGKVCSGSLTVIGSRLHVQTSSMSYNYMSKSCRTFMLQRR